MSDQPRVIPLDEAKRQVALVCRRLALLHIAFADAVVDALEPEEGKRLIGRAIKGYGKLIGDAKREAATRLGLEPTKESFERVSDLPSFGMHDSIERVDVEGEPRTRAHGCVMGKIWCEQGKADLGRMYCYVDPASSMAFNAGLKLVHTKSVPDGDPFCELAMRQTTAEDRKTFAADDTDWQSIERPTGDE
jgi:hypothetical protein